VLGEVRGERHERRGVDVLPERAGLRQEEVREVEALRVEELGEAVGAPEQRQPPIDRRRRDARALPVGDRAHDPVRRHGGRPERRPERRIPGLHCEATLVRERNP
jgi:hypothetical protein